MHKCSDTVTVKQQNKDHIVFKTTVHQYNIVTCQYDNMNVLSSMS